MKVEKDYNLERVLNEMTMSDILDRIFEDVLNGDYESDEEEEEMEEEVCTSEPSVREGVDTLALEMLNSSDVEIWESRIYNLENKRISMVLRVIDVEYINENATVLTYQSIVDGEEETVVANTMPSDVFSEEAGFNVCLLKAIIKEAQKGLKMY